MCRRCIVAASLACHCLAAVAVRGAGVTATVDRNTVAVGDTVTLSLSFDGVQVPQPSLPALPNFQIVSQGSSLNMDLTRGISLQTYTFALAPKAPGEFTIPSLPFTAGGQTFRTQPIAIKVIPGTALTTAFTKLLMPKKQLYVGEVSEVEVQVYWQEGRMNFPDLPVDSGFTVGKWLRPVESRVNMSNQVWGLVQFKQPITAVKAGLLTLGPVTVTVLVPDRSRRREIPVQITAPQTMIQVLPIPEQDVPPTFSGAVGNFSLSFSAAPTNLAAGDPITARVKITGRGALDAVRLPAQPDWAEFKTYPANSQIEGADASNTSGTKSFEQVVVPERAGIKVLPPFKFSFFDPDQKSFRTLSSAATPLNVAAGGSGTALPNLPGGASNAVPAQPASDLAHIKPFLGVPLAGPLLITRPWFLGLQAVPPALWLGLLLWRKNRERLANDPKARRRAEVAHKARQSLAELREHASAKNSDAFFATVMRMLQEQIGERIDAPANSITEAVVEERLRPAGAPRELCIATQKLFQRCNLARYAPVKSSEELSAVAPELEKVLRGLQEWEPSKS